MRFELQPPTGVDPIPVHVGMPASDAVATLSDFFGDPPVRFRIYRGQGWQVQRPGGHDTGLLFFDGGGQVIRYIELCSGATYYNEEIEVPSSDEVVFRGIELFNANSAAVLDALRSLNLDVVDETGYGLVMSLPHVGLRLTRESARRFPDDDPEEYPDTPWNPAVIADMRQ